MQNGSIFFRFAAISLSSILIVLGCTGFYDYWHASSKLKENQKLQAELLLSQTKLIAAPMLWDYEVERLQNTLTSLAQAQFIKAIFVIDSGDTVIGVKKDDNGKVELNDQIDQYKNFKFKSTVEYDDDGTIEEVGEIMFVIDKKTISSQLSSQILYLVFESILLAISLLVLLMITLRKVISVPINRVNEALKDINDGNGDLTQRIPRTSTGEIATLTTFFNQFVNNLQTLISGVVVNSQKMITPISQVHMVAKQTQTGAELQHKKINHMAESMDNMATAAQQVAQGTVEAANHAKEINENTKVADEQLQNMTQTIRDLAEDISTGANVINALQEDVTNIVTVLDVIRGIAEQTNLLALNAAIEAARAGEQGRGFAVVADEVRSLASKTQDSTQEIQVMIEKLQEGSGKAVEIMRVGKESGDGTLEKVIQTQDIVGRISNAITAVSDMTGQIASAAEQQTAMCKEVSGNLNEVVEVVGKVASDAKETYHTTDVLTELINDQNKLLNRFKT